MNSTLVALGILFVVGGFGGSLKVGMHGITIGGTLGGVLILLGAMA